MTCAFDKVVCPKGFPELLCYMQTANNLCTTSYTTISSVYGEQSENKDFTEVPWEMTEMPP